MPTVVKKRLLDVLQDDHKSYYELFNFFLDSDVSNFEKEKMAVNLLTQELERVDTCAVHLPQRIEDIKDWYIIENKLVCEKYQAYLSRRQQGKEREYFKNIGHAFEFLIKVAPTKKVDGSWLYSFVNYWSDPDFHHLISIYLEELGVGVAESNHVCIYDELLRSLGLEDFDIFLEDEYYHQAVIQLALGYAPPEFIPEIVGFNLGYEQLPLHLLITNYELKELGIDSKYFNLHITIDNLDNGHAHKSIRSLENIYKKYKCKDTFVEKVKRGYALNQHGMTSMQIIQHLDLEKFLYKILKRKALIGALVHNDKCQIGGKSINQWLNDQNDIEAFVQQLIEKKWIRFNTNPEHSPFWRMISHEDGKMYGVFNSTEKQIIYDWIAGEQYPSNPLPYQKIINLNQYSFHSQHHHEEIDQLQQRVEQLTHFSLKLCKLSPFLAPDTHHKSIGLWSTQKYTELLFPYLIHSKS